MKKKAYTNYTNIPEVCIEYANHNNVYRKYGEMVAYIKCNISNDHCTYYLYFKDGDRCKRNAASITGFWWKYIDDLIDRDGCIDCGVWVDYKPHSRKMTEMHWYDDYFKYINYEGDFVRYSEHGMDFHTIIYDKGNYQYYSNCKQCHIDGNVPMNEVDEFNVMTSSLDYEKVKMLEKMAIADGWI